MTSILTLTLNPALDIAASVDHIVIGPKLRCEGGHFSAGGGGVNASRAIQTLGGESDTFVAVGGSIGALLVKRMHKAGITPILFETNGETRQNISVHEVHSNQQLRVVLPGPVWQDRCQTEILPRIMELVTPDTWVIASGSLPDGLPADFYVHLNTAIITAGARMILDTSNPALTASVNSARHPYEILRMNRLEAEALAKKPFATISEEADFAKKLVEDGVARIAILARGGDGSIIATSGRCFIVHPPKTPVQSKVGAGDSFVGALTLALSNGQTLETAAILAASAAASAVQTTAGNLCEKPAVEMLVPQCVVERL